VLPVFAVWTGWGLWTLHQRNILALLTGIEAPARTNPWPLIMASAWLWALATLAIMVITRRIRDHAPSLLARLGWHVGAFAIWHLIDVSVYWAASRRFDGDARPYLAMLISLVTFNALAYTVAALGTNAMDAAAHLRKRALREAQLETRLTAAQLHGLRAQLQPHFLFNALNAVSSLITIDPLRAERMLARLGDLLRTTVETAPLLEVTLAEEFALAQRYLEIEQERFGDRLAVQIDPLDGLAGVRVPNMLLQPLLENAVRHGVAPHSHHGRVTLRAERSDDGVRITVADSGGGFDRGTPAGMGLRITTQRLMSTYGDRARLTYQSTPDGFEARVNIAHPVHRPGGVT
jgi:hypothetical protein